MKPHDEIIELFKFLARGNKLKIDPHNHAAELSQYQLCTSQPVPTVQNFEAVCGKCGCLVWYSEKHPHLIKICIMCFLKGNPKPGQSVANLDPMVRASLLGKRN